MSGARITITGVGKHFGLTRVLSNIDVTMQPGHITAFVGPNGAGKTTLFSAICGEIRPIEGRVELDGCDISRLPPDRVARLGIGKLFQEVRVFRNVTVRDNVTLAILEPPDFGVWTSFLRASHHVAAARQRADVFLREVGLFDRADEPAEELSWGNRKLLAFARLLASRPRVLLLDEPASGVSPMLKKQLKCLIRQQVEDKGITIGLIEHDMNFVSEIADWVVVLDEGELLDQGPPQEILQQTQFIELLVGL